VDAWTSPWGVLCYSASSERKLLLHKLMCVVMSAVVIALCRAIRVVCLHDVSMIAMGVEGADQGEEEPSHHHVAPGMSITPEPSHMDSFASLSRVYRPVVGL
jgi:hypothetical protein